jgi:hypothetical protein
LALYLSFSSGVGVTFAHSTLHSPTGNSKQGPIPEEMSQTLLTNKKQGKPGPKYTTLTLLKGLYHEIDFKNFGGGRGWF